MKYTSEDFGNLVFVLLEGLIILSSILIAMIITFSLEKITINNPSILFLRIFIFVAVFQLCLYFNDLYEKKTLRGKKDLVIRIFQSLGAGEIILLCLYYFFNFINIGVATFLTSIFLLTAALLGWRLFFSWMSLQEGLKQNLVIMGAGDLARKIIKASEQYSPNQYNLRGILAENKPAKGKSLMGINILGTYESLEEVVNDHKIDTIVVAMPDSRGKLPIPQFLEMKLRGIDIEEATAFYEKITGKIAIENLRPSYIIFSKGFKMSGIPEIMRRLFEIALSLIAFILLSPLLGAIALIIKIESAGPVLFKQKRVGKNGKIFELYKFRSMKTGAEAGSGPVWARKGDARVTRPGRIMRKTRVDELPQLMNVIRGEMSIVGPRPERPYFIEKLKKEIPYYTQRLMVKPGLTGWAQIKYHYGASTMDAIEKLQYDLYYMKNRSILFDFLIICESVKVILLGKGAV
jgi:sugar transferase (PEP-CTERM system associated)